MSAPKVLFMCDFPPCNYLGGPVLISRLFMGYDYDSLTVLTSSYTLKLYPHDGRLSCKHIGFPQFHAVGRFGKGRIRNLWNFLLLLLLPVFSVWIIKRMSTQVIVTIAHGYFFLIAAFVSRVTSLPLVLMVHDDWVSGLHNRRALLSHFSSKLFSAVLRQASQVYSVSPYMQEYLKLEYDIDSDLQMPAIEYVATEDNIQEDDLELGWQCIRILYAGAGVGSDSLDCLIRLMESERLRALGIPRWELHLYTPSPPMVIEQRGDGERINFHGWVPQHIVRAAMQAADILFLPFPFEEKSKYVTLSSFPTKTSDYLISGKPILICAPEYSSIVRYARNYSFAEIVNELDEEKLAQAIYRIWKVKEHRNKLVSNAFSTFRANHNIIKQRADFIDLLNRLVPVN